MTNSQDYDNLEEKDEKMVETRNNSTGLHLKLVLLTIVALAIGATIMICVIEVGNLHEQSAILQACLDNPNGKFKGCPDTPINPARIRSLKDTANTLGNVGWFAVLLLIFPVGGALLDSLRRR